MALSQAIILYFFIIPIISFLILAVIESYFEDKKKARKKDMKLKKEIQNLNRKLEYIEYRRLNKMQFVGCTIK